MTEEIIVNDVNVAECNAYKDEHCKDKTSIMFCDTNLCSNYPYCYYKQLKRLEQENKELKENLKSQQMINLKQQEIALDYWNVLEEINLILDELKQQYDYMTDYSEIKEIQNRINEVLQ